MAGGLTPRRLGAELEEHGGYDGAIAAHPELADELRLIREAGDLLARQAKEFISAMEEIGMMISSTPEPLEVLELEPPSPVEQFAAGLELGLDRRAARVQKKKSGKRKPGFAPASMSHRSFQTAFSLLVAGGMTQEEIAAKANITRHYVREINDWRTRRRRYDVYSNPSDDTVTLRRRSDSA
jgi:hypothetical protein